MNSALIEALLGYQAKSGAFRATREAADGSTAQDETCLFTAQVCLTLLRPGVGSATAPLRRALGLGLDFVEGCAAPGGWFRMHAPAGGAADARPDLPNTALAWLALLLAGRRSPGDARRTLSQILSAAAVAAPRPEDPGWVVPGLCRSWPGEEPDPACPDNPVDLIANIHLAGCCARAGLRLRADLAGAMTRACADADLSSGCLLRLSPFAASPAEIEIALERAVRAGEEALVPALKSIRARKFGKLDRIARRPADRPLHCQPGGAPRWSAPSLQLARWLDDLSHGTRPMPAPLQPSL